MIEYRLKRPCDLTPTELTLWDRLQRSHRDFESPYFRPEFTQAVASIRDDVEVAILTEYGKPAGYFPFQRSSLNMGKPVAGRLNDFHGVLAPPGFRVDARDLLRATRLAVWDFEHFVGDQPSFTAVATEVHDSGYIDISQGYAAYCQERKQSGTEVIRKTVSRERKFEREVGPLRYEVETSQPERVLETLINWKIAQFERTGYFNLFAFDWTRQLLRTLLTGHLSMTGMLSVLWHGDEPIAISYKLRSFRAAHAWFIAYNHDYSAYSTGMILMLKDLEALAERGVERLHLGSGDQRFKESLSNGVVPVRKGTVEAPAACTLLRHVWRWTRDTARGTPALASWGRMSAAMLKPLRTWMAFR